MTSEEMAQMPRRAEEFARQKRTVQGCSEKTVAEYLLDLRLFFRFLRLKLDGTAPTAEALESCDISSLTDNDFDTVTPSDVYDFLYYLDTVRGDSAPTRARKLSSLKAFYKFMCAKRGYISNNPCENIESPKLKKKLPRHLSVSECMKLLDAVEIDTASKTRERDFAMLTLFLNCGMRLSELAGISMRDIDRDMRSLRVTGKGAKERIIYLNDACRAALGDYITHRTSMQLKPGEGALFVSLRGSRISTKTVQYTVNKYLSAAGLGNKGYSTHKLRHTAATLMYQTGDVDIRVLKDILGHEQLNTTQIYTHVSNKGMEDAMTRNPLSAVMPHKSVTADLEDEGKKSDE